MDGYFLAGNKTVYTRPTAMGGGKIYGRFILQPCRKEVDPVFNLRRHLNKIVETMVDPTQDGVRTIQLESLDAFVKEFLDLFHPQDVWDGYVSHCPPGELQWKSFSELRSGGRGGRSSVYSQQSPPSGIDNVTPISSNASSHYMASTHHHLPVHCLGWVSRYQTLFLRRITGLERWRKREGYKEGDG